MKKPSDQELIALLKKHDPAALTEIYRRYWDNLFVIANNRIKNSAEAEEILQDIFLSLWKKRQILEIQHTLYSYLAAAVKYQIINRQALAYNKTIREELTEQSDQPLDTTELWFAERELREQLILSINKLPVKCRLIFLKSREEGKTNGQIAQEFNISKKAVEGHISRALNILKKSLQVSAPLLFYLLKK